MVILCVQWYKVVVLFVDIGEIFDHQFKLSSHSNARSKREKNRY